MSNLYSQNVSSGSVLTLSAGISAGPVTVQSSGILIVSGGTANNTSVFDGGVAGVMTGGAMNTVNMSGGNLTIGSAGQANDVTLTDSASLFVQSAGKGNNINAQNGSIAVASGANVSGVQVGSGAEMNISKGGIASGITVSAGGTVGKFTQNAETATIAAMNGSAFAGAVTGLNAIGDMTTVSGANVTGGKFASGTFNVQDGTVSGLTVGNSGVMNVTSNTASVNGTTLTSGGSMMLNDNAKATNTILTSGATLNTFTHVGTASATVASVVGNNVNGAVNGVVFTGIMNTAAGANLTNVTVSDGALNLAKDAKANSLTVKKGFAYIYSGAIASGIEVEENGALRLNAGATAANVSIAQGGKVLDFKHTGSTVATIGTVTDKGIGGTVSNLSVTGNANILAQGNAKNLTVCADGLATFKSNAKAESAIINNDGTLVVENGAIVNNVTLQNGGNLNVAVGGSAVDVTQNYGGYINLIVQGGDTKTLITGKNAKGSSFVYSNGVASDFIVYAGQKFVVSSGGSARNIVAEKGAVVSAALGADITGYSADMGNYSISGGVISGLTTLANFELIIENGYAVDGQNLIKGGVQSVTSRGVVTRTRVNKDGEIRVGYNGSALNVSQAAGGKISLDIHDSAALTTITGSRTTSEGITAIFQLESGVAKNFAISSGASMTIHSGGQAINSLIEAGGKMVLSSGGNVSSISMKEGAILSANVYAKDTVTALSAKKTYNSSSYDMTIGNGKANNIVLDNGGRLNVFSDASAEDVIVDDSYLFVDHKGSATAVEIKNGGSAFVEANGLISSATIEDNSELRLAAGAFLTGNVMIKGQLICEGPITQKGNPVNITIDISERTKDDPAAIRNISSIANANYTVLVDYTSTGKYKLATNALNFSEAITINMIDASGKIVALGLMKKDSPLQFATNKYSLKGTAGELYLEIENTFITVEAETAPTKGSVSVRATFNSDNCTVQQYSFDNKNWLPYSTTGVEMPENGTVYFRGCTDPDDPDNTVIAITSYTVTNIDNVPPTITVTQNNTAPTNQNVFVSAEFSSDCTVKQYSFDQKNWNAYISSVEMTENGKVYFRGKDAAGNEVGYNGSVYWDVTNIDKDAPEQPGAKQNVTDITQGSVTVYATFHEEGTAKEYSFDNENWLPYNTTGVEMQENGTVYFRETDAAGNSSVTKHIVSNIGIAAPTNISATVKKYTLTLKWDKLIVAKGQKATYTIRVNGEEYTSKSNKLTISKLAPGDYTYSVSGTITQKNKEPIETAWSSSAKAPAVIDITAPKMSKVTAVQSTEENKPVSVTVTWDPATDNDNDKIKEYVVTCETQSQTQRQTVGGDVRSCTFDNVLGTKAKITVTASDAAGNYSKQKKINLTIKDMIDPSPVGEISQDGEITNKYVGTFSWEPATDNSGSIAKYKVVVENENGKTITKYVSGKKNSIKLSKLGLGNNTITVTALDKAKRESKETTYEFFVADQTAPKTVSVKAKVTDNDVTFTWKKPKDNADSIEQGVTEYILRYGDANDTTQASWTPVNILTEEADISYDIMGLNKGKYKFEMVAKDAAGNYSSVRKGSFNIKTELPVPALLELETTLLGPAGSDTDLTSWNSGGTQDTSIYDPASSTTDLLSDDPGSYAADISSLASADVSTLFGLDEKQNSGSLAVLG